MYKAQFYGNDMLKVEKSNDGVVSIFNKKGQRVFQIQEKDGIIHTVFKSPSSDDIDHFYSEIENYIQKHKDLPPDNNWYNWYYFITDEYFPSFFVPSLEVNNLQDLESFTLENNISILNNNNDLGNSSQPSILETNNSPVET